MKFNKKLIGLLLALAIVLPVGGTLYNNLSPEKPVHQEKETSEPLGNVSNIKKKEPKEEIKEETVTDNDNEVAYLSLEKATVDRVIDGDTLIATNEEGTEMHIRFIGIDTPESVHPDESKNTEDGIYASEFTTALLPAGKTIYLEKDVSDIDKYDRYLRYIWLKEDIETNPNIETVKEFMVNGILLDQEWAEIATFKPDVKYVDIFKELAK